MYDHLNFITPPEKQGQLVEYSYALDPDREQVVCRYFDASDRTEGYCVAPIEDMIGEFEPWNRAPRLEDEGRWEAVL